MELPRNRVLSLDVFRGITIAGMVLVNNPGSWSYVYPPLDHAEWHGWTPTDLVFPFFLFIMGVSMAFSLSRKLQSGMRPTAIYLQIFRRAAILFGLGMFLHLIPINFPAGYNWFTDTLMKVRIMGVLQRIAVVYLFASLIVSHSKPRGQAAWGLGLLAAYWAIMKLIPFTVVQNGAAVTYVGTLDKEINLAAYVDDLILHGHTWKIGTYFHTDPEGLLSTIPAIATTLIGVFTGYWLKSEKPQYEIVSGLFFAGVIGLLLGTILDAGFPINKNLWSPSYVVFMGGMALIFLAMCYYLIDLKGYRRWIVPFVIFGMNPIVLYVLSEAMTSVLLMIHFSGGVTLGALIYEYGFVSWLGNLNGSLAFAITYVLFWLGMMAILYKKRIFIKI